MVTLGLPKLATVGQGFRVSTSWELLTLSVPSLSSVGWDVEVFDNQKLVSADLSSPDDLQLIAYLTIGGVIRKVTPVNLIFDGLASKAQGPLTMVTAVPGLPAGQYEAVLSIRNLEPDGALTVKAGLYIEFVEIKRAAL